MRVNPFGLAFYVSKICARDWLLLRPEAGNDYFY